MSWWQISAIVQRQHVGAVEDQLVAAGALAITLGDAGDDPQLEPLPGEQPLWSSAKVTGLFALQTDPQPLLQSLLLDQQVLAEVEPLADRDWEREWLKHFKPLKFGDRLWIQPTGMHCDAGVDDVLIHLDPGLAFGTGTHPTTALCLEWLANELQTDSHWIDYGCGSGILAVAAAKLGAAKVSVIDIDPQALMATEQNARRNHVATQIQALEIDQTLPNADGVVANILAGPLLQLAEKLASAVRPGGRIVLSGILAEQGPAVQAAYQAYFGELDQYQRDGWLCLVGRRS